MKYCVICFRPLGLGDSWFSFVFPKYQSPVCEECQGKLEPIHGEICAKCGRPMEGINHLYKRGTTCLDCHTWQEHGDVLACNRSVYVYNEFMKEMMALFKFRGDALLAEAFSAPFQAAYKEHFSSFAVMPIPLSEARHRERGFNQAHVLANLLQVPVHTNVLIRMHTEKQSKKTRYERIMSVSPFSISSAILPCERIVLIDDVYTTGATVRQAAKLLHSKGALQVASLTLVRSTGE